MNEINNRGGDKIAGMSFVTMYPLYLKKCQKKGKSKEEPHLIIKWLTGYDENMIKEIIDKYITFKEFFEKAMSILYILK